ncbi:type VI secretion protein [Streptomyces sp. NPDC101132]|uniref:type VI secretion protein n=1 Tax=Streptomyces sp. NPDC101132 TaxID=3366110 RepID=UPI00382B6F77
MPRDGARGHAGGGTHGGREHQPRGVPDALLVGLLAFLLGLTVLVWTSTGLAALFARGAWPDTVTFSRTPVALRQLVAQPHDLAGAWPDTPPAALSGWGLFWGILISQLLVLFVLVVFAMGVLARLKARRALARTSPPGTYAPAPADPYAPRHPYESPEPYEPRHPAASKAPAPPAHTPAPAPESPTAPAAREPAPEPVPAPRPAEAPTAAPARPAWWEEDTKGPRVRYGGPEDRYRAAVRRIAEAEGAALVVTSSPALWAATKDARAKLGPVLLYDPTHQCDTPARLHWHPGTGCADRDTAAARAVALLAPVRPQARIDAAVADTAETLLRSWLHAAALDDRPFKQLHRWAQGAGTQEPVRILRTHPKAAPGTAGELENALTAHPERREIARELTARALSSMSSVHIRDACTPNRTDSLALASFPAEGGTLYVVGEPIEDPRTSPGAMPLLTALASSVVEHGRRMAARSSDGRLDPPMSLVLDDVAAVAPVPQLPALLSPAVGDPSLPLLALLRSREQGRARWPDAELPEVPSATRG